MASQNNVKIAGHKLQWQWVNGRDSKLLDEEGNTLYYIQKLYRGDGSLVHDAKGRPQYQVHLGDVDGEPLGEPQPYVPSAKGLAERHFAEANNGKFEGLWTKR
jgi:hypothetical protein